MSRGGKVSLIILIGFAVTFIAAGVTGNWGTHILSTYFFMIFCVVVAFSDDGYKPRTTGWVVFVVGLMFTVVIAVFYHKGGPTFAGCKLAAWLCGFESVVFGLIVGAIKVVEKKRTDR